MLKLLLIEDDLDVAANIAEYLEAQGHGLDFAYDGPSGLKLALANAQPPARAFDVIMLDIGLPLMDGLEVGAALRRSKIFTPILVLTARDALTDKAAAFELGVDDYLVKPFALAELGMRIQALHRRAAEQGFKPDLQVGDLIFNTATQIAHRSGVRLSLNRSQRRILTLLLRASPNLVSKSALIEELWGDEAPSGDALRMHLFELRQVVDKPFAAPLIHTLHGAGYALHP